MFTSFKFWWNTKFRPRFVPHYWCEFWNWTEKKKDIGWYILDHKGRMIPWVHFGKSNIICLYEDMITKITLPLSKKEYIL